jgi:hypothetical protein
LNCFYDIRQDQDKHATIVRGTPGFSASYSLSASPIRGFRVVESLLYIVAGSQLYSVNTSGTVTTLGTLGSSAGTVGMSDNGVQLGVVDGVAGYCYTIVTGSYAQAALNAAGSFGVITDANFPDGALTMTFLDGNIICERRPASRQFYVSAKYDLTNWTNASSLPTYGTKDNYSDDIVAVDVLNGALVLWGTDSIEFWQDVGSSPLPFTRINGATQLRGLVAINSRVFIADTLLFLGKAYHGDMVQIYRFNGYQPVRVSTADIEEIIEDFTTWTDAVALTYTIDGHPMYQITFPIANRSFLYDLITGFWSEVQTGVAVTARHFANFGVAFNTKTYVSDSSTGTMYILDDEVYTDNGTPTKRQVTSRHLHADGNMFGIAELWIDMETGVGLQSGQGSDPEIMLQVSKDGGRTFGIEKWAKIGTVGSYGARVGPWRRLGMSRDFVVQFTMTDPVKFVIISGSAVLQQEEGKDG